MKRGFEDTSLPGDTDPDEEAGPSKKKTKKQQKSSKNKNKNKNKPQTKANKDKQGSQAVDPTYGQRCVLPGIDDGGNLSDDDLDCEDIEDAMAYLLSVRHEANAIPHIIVAPKLGPQLPTSKAAPRPPSRQAEHGLMPDSEEEGEVEEDGEVRDEGRDQDEADANGLDYSTYTNGTGDFRGYYQDGAFTAVPDAWLQEGHDWDSASSSPSDRAVVAPPSPSDPSAQAKTQSVLRLSYFAALVDRFETLRVHLQQDPPAAAVAALPKTHKRSVEQFATKSSEFGAWNHRLKETDPLPAQIASMGRLDVVRLLRILLNGSFFRRGHEVDQRTSQWTWALLARLPERGELDHQEIGYVRELGKKAVLLMRSMIEMDALVEVADLEEGNTELNTPVDMEVKEGEEKGEEGGGDTGDASDDDYPTEHGDGIIATEKEDATPASDTKALSLEEDLQLQAEDAPSEVDEGEVSEDGEVLDDGEAPPDAENNADSLDAAKARLLAQLDQSRDVKSDVSMDMDSDDSEAEPNLEFDTKAVAKMNTRATLNMILTVAGEFYGQRDLLEFRDPFMRI